MSFQNKNCIDGELLRNLREAQAMDITLLSRRVNLSVAQLRQLECAELAQHERSLFYSDAIRAAAARKVALALGADPDQLAAVSSTESSPVHEMQVLDDLALLLEKQRKSQLASQRWDFLSSRLLWMGLLLSFAGALVWHFQKPLFSHERSLISAMVQVLPVVAAAGLPASESVPLARPESLVVSQETPEVSPDSLCAQKVSGAALKASVPNKAGNLVHIVAQADTVVCVQDATGKKTAAAIKASESRSFYGAAPWTVHFDKPPQVQLFFQGQRLRWPDGEPLSFTLQEVPGPY